MATISVWAARWSTGYDVLIADYRIKEENKVTIENGKGQGTYYMSGAFARQFPTEPMQTKKGGIVTMRVIPLTELEKEVIA